MNAWSRVVAGVVLVAAWAGVALAQGPEEAKESVPAARLRALARGVNLSHWIWLPNGKTPEERAAFIGDGELRALREAGFTHARLPFMPGEVWDAAKHELRASGLAELRGAIGRVVDAGLAVVVDAHGSNLEWTRPEEASGRAAELEAFWGALAGELAGTDPDRVFVEILNEPHDIKDAGAWRKAQERVVGVVREKLPRHTIVVTGDAWGGIEGLKKLKPLADGNVVYSFHFYEPHTFTHQGATWGAEGWKGIRDLPYPSTPEGVRALAKTLEDEKARKSLLWQHKEAWDRQRIAGLIDGAAAWGKEHGVAVYCGEFGVYIPKTPRESRLAWLADVSGVLRERGIGWAMWDYCGGFGVVGEGRGLDEGVVEALGMGR